jgi:hypothetical protein
VTLNILKRFARNVINRRNNAETLSPRRRESG